MSDSAHISMANPFGQTLDESEQLAIGKDKYKSAPTNNTKLAGVLAPLRYASGKAERDSPAGYKRKK